jgi:hypothetical protein
MDDTVCLSGSGEHVHLMQAASSAPAFAAALIDSLQETRRHLVLGQPIYDRRGRDGARVTKYYGRLESNGSLRVAYEEEMVTRHNLLPDGLVCGEHNALCSAILPDLVHRAPFM